MFVGKKRDNMYYVIMYYYYYCFFGPDKNYLSASAVLHNEPFSLGPTRCTKCLIKKNNNKLNLKNCQKKGKKEKKMRDGGGG